MEDDARKWAFSIIESRDDPPVEIIEVALSPTQHQLIEALKAIAGAVDAQLVGRQLLAEAATKLRSDPSPTNLFRQIKAAMQISLVSGLPEDTYSAFASIADEISLAQNEYLGTVEEIHESLVITALEEFAKHGAVLD